ncbi:MAG TPA: phospholipase D family protein [Arenicellales bacterium]|nr:phospholipase D family protein [Arenicellales bacterium]
MDTDWTRLGAAVAPAASAHPGRSGFHALWDARDAFASRMLLIEAAEATLDIQYYIWRLDRTGTLMFDAVRRAAERGVRVRLLLDDNNTPGLDAVLAALDSHPNVAVRLFNPFRLRAARWIGYLTDFRRMNRRMHNKSFTADGQATIIGGRNIGDEYFGADDGLLFSDLDVLAVGPVAGEVSADFERYWASESSCPAQRILRPAAPGRLDALEASASRVRSDSAAAAYLSAAKGSGFVKSLLDGVLPLEWAPVRMVSDDPAKGLGMVDEGSLLFNRLVSHMEGPRKQLDLVSPYFVPGEQGVAALTALAERGVRVRVLLNSLEATDVKVVHAGYVKRRRSLLEAGVRLFESKLEAAPVGKGTRAGLRGSSMSSLHAKTFAVDQCRVFVGSFNFDPRSAHLNTELGFVIDSESLAARLSGVFDEQVPGNAYEACLAQDGGLYWLERRDGSTVQHRSEPGAGIWQRAIVWLVSLLPVDWLL